MNTNMCLAATGARSGRAAVSKHGSRLSKRPMYARSLKSFAVESGSVAQLSRPN